MQQTRVKYLSFPNGEFLITRPSFFSRKGKKVLQKLRGCFWWVIKVLCNRSYGSSKMRILRMCSSRESWSISGNILRGSNGNKGFSIQGSNAWPWKLSFGPFVVAEMLRPLVKPRSTAGPKTRLQLAERLLLSQEWDQWCIDHNTNGLKLQDLLPAQASPRDKTPSFFHSPLPHTFPYVGCLCSGSDSIGIWLRGSLNRDTSNLSPNKVKIPLINTYNHT